MPAPENIGITPPLVEISKFAMLLINHPECRRSPVYSPHLGRISVDVDDGGADHFGQVRRVVSGPAAVLRRREAHLPFRWAAFIETVG